MQKQFSSGLTQVRGNTVITVINSFTYYQQCEDIKKHKTVLIAAKVYPRQH